MSRAGDVAALAVVVVGAAVQVPAVDRVLSHFFAWALPVFAGLALLGWLAREAGGAVRDRHWMGPPARPARRRRREREDVEP